MPSAAGPEIPFIARGRVFEGKELTPFGNGQASPGLDLNELVWQRNRPLPLANVPTAEIIEILGEVSNRLKTDSDGLLAPAMAGLIDVCGAAGPIEERAYADLWRFFDPKLAAFQLAEDLGHVDAMESWRKVTAPVGEGSPVAQTSWVRAFPVRMLHVLAGNAPAVAATTIVRSALVKGASLLKMASNDVFTAAALLRQIALVAPGHPIEDSFSAVYWRGGDSEVESVIMRAQFFEKIVAWGGAQSIIAAAQYVGPGIELVSFDPKSSISVIGREALSSPGAMRLAAAKAATDATIHNQDACTASRFHYVQGDVAEIDRFCELLVAELGVERQKCTARSAPVPSDLREEIEALRLLEPDYRIFGKFDGTGMVVRSLEPVDFYPNGRVVNVVVIDDPKQVLDHVDASTQTVGVYPDDLRLELRDDVSSVGAQRFVSLGSAGDRRAGLPHDGFYPLGRMVTWVRDEW
jgi:hypothetical protein